MTIYNLLLLVPSRVELEALSDLIKKTGIEVLVGGIGPASTAFSLTRFFEKTGPRMLILAGIAGGFRPNGAELGKVCIASSEIFADLGRCGPHGFEPIFLDGEDMETHFPLEPGWNNILTKDFLDISGIISAPMATVSCVSGTEERAKLIAKAFNSYVENMEGAAAALVCKNYNMPLMEIRSISNFAGELNKKKWKLPAALKNLREKTEIILDFLLNNRHK